MNRRLMDAAQEQMQYAEELRREMDQAVTPEMHQDLIQRWQSAMAAGKVMVLDARDADPE